MNNLSKTQEVAKLSKQGVFHTPVFTYVHTSGQTPCLPSSLNPPRLTWLSLWLPSLSFAFPLSLFIVIPMVSSPLSVSASGTR